MSFDEKGRLICDPDLVVYRYDEEGRVIEEYPERSKTRQSEKDSADINIILERMDAQGIGPILNPSQPKFLDISDVPDFQTALAQVRDAREYFMQLDPEDRLRFENKVGKFLDTINDPVKLKGLIDEGIVVDGSIVGGPVPAGAGGAGAPPVASAPSSTDTVVK